MPVFSQGGQIVSVGGKPAAADGCCCNGETCDHCVTGTVVASVDLDISGTSDGSSLPCGGTECIDRDGLYSCALDTASLPSVCRWLNGDSATGGCCSLTPPIHGTTLLVRVIFTAGTYKLEAKIGSLYDPPSPCLENVATFQKDYGASKPDCSAFSGEVLTFISQTTGGGCDFSTSTVTVTSVP